jgi:hypothetical protein
MKPDVLTAGALETESVLKVNVTATHSLLEIAARTQNKNKFRVYIW